MLTYVNSCLPMAVSLIMCSLFMKVCKLQIASSCMVDGGPMSRQGCVVCLCKAWIILYSVMSTLASLSISSLPMI